MSRHTRPALDPILAVVAKRSAIISHTILSNSTSATRKIEKLLIVDRALRNGARTHSTGASAIAVVFVLSCVLRTGMRIAPESRICQVQRLL